MIAYLLLRIAHAARRTVESPLPFARLVRANLMHLKTIHDLAKLEPPPPAEASLHLDLVLR